MILPTRPLILLTLISSTLTWAQTSTRSETCETPINSEQGLISGFLETRHGHAACAYKGIPYAQAPIGKLRWQAPQAPLKRKALLKATQYGADCMQNKIWSDAQALSGTTKVSEDCLYLDIYTPPTNVTPKAVMLWIHGGCYTTNN